MATIPQNTLQALSDAATKFRGALESYCAKSDHAFDRGFPSMWCKTASILLAQYLSDVGLGRAALVANAIRRSTGGGTETHAWLRLNGFDIDITADQFPGEKRAVLIEPLGVIHGEFTNASTHEWEAYMNLSPCYRAETFEPRYSAVRAILEQ